MTAESENEKLKRQIQYLTDLINSSSRLPSFRPEIIHPKTRSEINHPKSRPEEIIYPKTRPDTNNQLLRTYRIANSEGKGHSNISTLQTHGSKGKYSSHFSWKKSSVSLTEQNIIGQALESSSKCHNFSVGDDVTHKLEQQPVSVSCGLKTFKQAGKLTEVRKLAKCDHSVEQKTSKRNTVDSSNEDVKSTLSNENYTIEKGKLNLEAMSKRLRNHPFMNRTKNIIYSKDISSKDEKMNSSIDAEKNVSEVESFKKNQLYHEKGEKKSTNSKQQVVMKPHCVENSKKGHVDVDKKTEMIEELNRKLLETSCKIHELKKNLYLKKSLDRKNLTELPTKQRLIKQLSVKPLSKLGACHINSSVVDKISINRVSSSSQDAVVENSKTKQITTTGEDFQTSSPNSNFGNSKCHENTKPLMKLIDKLNSSPVGQSEKVLTVKSRYSLRKTEIDVKKNDKKGNANFKPIDSSDETSQRRKTSRTRDDKHTFKSKFLLQNQGHSRTDQASSVQSSMSHPALQSEDMSSRTPIKVVKSKYSFKKIPSNSLTIPNTSTALQINGPKIVSRYKLQKANIPSGSKYSSGISRTMVASNIIKSKYKLRKVSNTALSRRQTPMKTVLKTKFKLKKVPSHLVLYQQSSTRSFYYQNEYPEFDMHSYGSTAYLKNFTGKRKYNGKRSRSQFSYRYPSHYGNKLKYTYHASPRCHLSNRRISDRLTVHRRYILNHLHTLRSKKPGSSEGKERPHKGAGKNVKLVVINGMLYKSSGHSLVKTNQSQTHLKESPLVVKKMNASGMKIVKVRGVKFQMDSSGKTLRRMDSSIPTKAGNTPQQVKESHINRVDIGGITYIQTKPGTLEQVGSNQAKVIASRVKNRSIMTAAAKYKKDNTKKVAKKYCVFYNRFGKCQRGDKCPYQHDPDRVAVCTRFLRGTCRVDDCPFSHKVSKEKMPTCSYFLRGVCNRDNCPYLHVNVGKTAKVCEEFLKGFCSMGERCTERHILHCPSFTRTGACTEEKPCKLKHIKRNQRHTSHNEKETSVQASVTKPNRKRVHNVDDDSDIPFKQRRLPAFISITSDDDETILSPQPGTSSNLKPAMKIRPKLK